MPRQKPLAVPWKCAYIIMGQEISAEVQQSGRWHIIISTHSLDARTIDLRETPMNCHLKKAMKPFRDGPHSTSLGEERTLIHLPVLEWPPVVKQIFGQPLALKASLDHEVILVALSARQV